MSDYATLARIEDHLRRIADALEGQPLRYHLLPPWATGDTVTATLRTCSLHDGCDDRTCTDRDHWAPFGRVNHGIGEVCIHGDDHSDALECVYRCGVTMPGHWCTRAEHSDDRHVWALSDEEAQRILRAGQELGFVAEADPLDEDDHRPRHDRDGDHWHKGPHGWTSDGPTGYGDDRLEWVADSYGPLTFCDCDDTTATDGATD